MWVVTVNWMHKTRNVCGNSVGNGLFGRQKDVNSQLGHSEMGHKDLKWH